MNSEYQTPPPPPIHTLIQSLVLEVKGLKQGYMFKNRPFYISFVLFNFQAGLNIPR